MNYERIPPVIANVGQACYYCFKEKTAENSLSKCSGCYHVSYCGPGCQKAHWSKHKALCKAYKAVETNHGRDILAPYYFLPDDEDSLVVTDVRKLNECLGRVGTLVMQRLEAEVNRSLRIDERNLVGWEPRCLACGHSDATFRIEAKLRDRKPQSAGLKPCPTCRLSFCCSEEHWEVAKFKHQNEPCQDRLCFEDARFAQLMSGANAGEFKWAPERTVTSWSSLRNTDWSDYEPGLAQAFSSVSTMGPEFLKMMLRGAAENMSMPLTILWGLENLNSDDAWTQKDVLNIHILGAADKEVLNSQMFEEILHRVPLVKTLKLTFIGPELGRLTGPYPSMTEMDTCPQCLRHGRKRIHDHQPKTYHDYIIDEGSKFIKPDLAVAFDSGCSQEDIESWKKSYVALHQRGIPSVFTAFNSEEAQAEADLFKSIGVTLHPELGPKHNPWGSLLSKIEPNKVAGFYAVNGWLSGGFR
ncbi:hypothetical protein CPB84DRAFT_1838982 [Gymnopilus junonius]|uniref:MYND-type domain-containing protein n=1 Tax=Gymnopilus junonius TaxID=109634 RepID=A0A9P5N804_GYMJU|nr:hypothetical protein CPB84DRAFT_1838982 [Gymnopilus junonius]